MPSTIDYQPGEYDGFYGMFQGPSGGGKSGAALSFPEPYVMDFDGKMPGIALKMFPGKKIDWDTYKDVFAAANVIERWITNGCPYATIIVDSITSLATLALNSVGQVKNEPVPKMMKNVKENRSKGTKTIEMMSYDYYNGETNFINRYLMEQLQLLFTRPGYPNHVIYLAHTMVKESTDIRGVTTKQSMIVTAGQKTALIVPTKMDETYYFNIEKGALKTADNAPQYDRICYTGPFEDYINKTKYPIPYRIDITDRNFYDELCKYVKFRENAPPKSITQETTLKLL